MSKKFYKIRKNLLLFIFTVLLAALGAVGLTACTHEVTEDDLRQEYPIKIIYDYQGGHNPSNDKSTTEVLIKKGNPAPNPSNETSKLDAPEYKGHSFKCFCEAQKGEDGEYLLDEDGNYKAGEVWDFSTVPTSDTVLLAQWWDNYKLVLHYGENLSKTQETLISRDTNGNPGRLTNSAFVVSNYTFLDYYFDEDMTEHIDTIPIPNLTSAMFEDSQDKLSLDVYGDGLDGNFVIVRSASDMAKFTGNGVNLYILNDIDMSEYSGTLRLPTNYNGTIIGNNHEIKNITISTESPSTSTSVTYGLFMAINSNANISDITFTNITYSVNCTNPNIREGYIGLFAGTVQSGAVINNVHISGTLDYELCPGFTNMDALLISDFIANNNAIATVENSGASSVEITHVAVVYTSNKNTAVYIKYKGSDDNITIEDVYGIAYNSNGNYRQDRLTGDVVKNDDGSYTLTAVNSTYNVTVSYQNNQFTATVDIVVESEN